MITTADFSKGVRILIDGEPYMILEHTTQTPSARGAATLVKFKARNLLTGQLISDSVKAGAKYEQPDIRFAKVQYLYDEGPDAVFMDTETYEQFNLAREVIGESAKYLSEDLEIKAIFFNDNVVNVELPNYVELEIVMVEPGTRGNTASGSVTTPAELSNGVRIQVPLHIKSGQRILVDTRDDSFYQKA